MKDGRGTYAKTVQKKNREAIKAYIAENPNSIRKEICEAVGVTFTTLRSHLKAMGIK